MRVRSLPVAWCLALLAASPAGRAADAPAAAPDPARLRAYVDALAAPALAGRGTAEARERAAAWLEGRLAAAGLRPPPGRAGAAMDLVARPAKGLPAGRNLLAWVPGAAAGEHVVLAAAYDGRPPSSKATYPGADATCSGVAAVLAAAQALAAGPPPRRAVLVALLDLADHGDAGGRALLAAPPVAGSTAVAAVVAERLGRSLADAMPGVLFVLRAGAGLGSALERAAVPPGLTRRVLGLDFVTTETSSALPFEEAGLPTLLVTAGPSRDDGTPDDVAGRVDPSALAARAAALAALTRAVADADGLAPGPAAPDAATRLEEARTLRASVAAVVAGGAPALTPPRRRLADALLRHLDLAVARGAVTVGERLAARLLTLQLAAGLRDLDR